MKIRAVAVAILVAAGGAAEADDGVMRAWALSGQLADAWSTERGLAAGIATEGNPGVRWLARDPVLLYGSKVLLAEGSTHYALKAAREAERRAERMERLAFAPGLTQEERTGLLKESRGELAAARWARRVPVVVGALGWGAFAWNMGAGGRYCHAHPNADQCR